MKLEPFDRVLEGGKEEPRSSLEEVLERLGRAKPKTEEFINRNHTPTSAHPNLPAMPAGIGTTNNAGKGSPEDYKFAMKVFNVKTSGGVRAEVDDVSWFGKELTVTGSFYIGETAPGGEMVGYFTRTFNGKGSVSHDIIDVTKDYRGQGIASEFNAHAEEMYKAYGIREIHLSTTSIGGYAWAVAGYEFDGDIRRAGGAIVQGLRSMAKGDGVTIQSNAVRDEAWRLLDRIDHGVKVAPYEIAQIGRDEAINNTWAGKSLLIGMQWYGVKRLDATPKVSVNTDQAKAADRARLESIMKTAKA